MGETDATVQRRTSPAERIEEESLQLYLFNIESSEVTVGANVRLVRKTTIRGPRKPHNRYSLTRIGGGSRKPRPGPTGNSPKLRRITRQPLLHVARGPASLQISLASES